MKINCLKHTACCHVSKWDALCNQPRLVGHAVYIEIGNLDRGPQYCTGNMCAMSIVVVAVYKTCGIGCLEVSIVKLLDNFVLERIMVRIIPVSTTATI